MKAKLLLLVLLLAACSPVVIKGAPKGEGDKVGNVIYKQAAK